MDCKRVLENKSLVVGDRIKYAALKRFLSGINIINIIFI